MAILKTLRSADRCPPSGHHPYIDTPDFAYDRWLSYLDDNGKRPIGNVEGKPAVAVIGAGVSGLCAAYELLRAGCAVTVFEASDRCGGRCDSQRFAAHPTDIAEMGSMRFPPTEFILDFYLKNAQLLPGGLCSQPDFPDPGVEWTYVCYGGELRPPWKWNEKHTNPPAGFETVYKGWIALITGGLNADLPAAQTITNLLAGGDVANATRYWQNYLNAFGQQTFYGALHQIFTGAGGYPIPGGTAWTFEDFDKFGALGIGSGGFAPLYPIGFMDIFRLIVNELETTQKFLQPSGKLTDGIRTLPLAFAKFVEGVNSIRYGTPIKNIGRSNAGIQLATASGTAGPFARVIMATTTRAMELTLNLTSYRNNLPLVSPAVAQAIMRTHVVSSNKVAALIKNYWKGNPNAVRCLQTDNMVHQVYTLDYTPVGRPPDQHGVCFISYVWDDDAVKQQALTSGVPTGPADNQRIYDYLLSRLASIGEPVRSWALNNLKPLNDDYRNNVFFEEWQSSPYFAGAFKLSQPGQDEYVRRMFFDYQKAGTNLDTGVYIAGDCIAWTSGWVEGALTTGLNAAAGVIRSLGGTLNPDKYGKTPLDIAANRYRY